MLYCLFDEGFKGMKMHIRMKREVKEKEKKKEATSVYVSADYWITSGYRVIRHLSRLDILAWNLVEGLRVYESSLRVDWKERKCSFLPRYANQPVDLHSSLPVTYFGYFDNLGSHPFLVSHHYCLLWWQRLENLHVSEEP